ncbi:MAG: hypothetical protein ACOY31_07035 [Bacillota bacterium]
MPFIFIVNDISLGKNIISAPQVVNSLLDRSIWLFNPIAPKLKEIKENEKILVYIAGKGRRYFYADFEIAGQVQELTSIENLQIEKLTGLFSLFCSIRDIKRWQKPLRIEDIKEELEFIVDQKNWGLFFRQSIKKISINDFNFIINQPH